MSQQLPVTTGGIRGPTLWALQETLVQEVGDFRWGCRAKRVFNSETLKLEAIIRAGL